MEAVFLIACPAAAVGYRAQLLRDEYNHRNIINSFIPALLRVASCVLATTLRRSPRPPSTALYCSRWRTVLVL